MQFLEILYFYNLVAIVYQNISVDSIMIVFDLKTLYLDTLQVKPTDFTAAASESWEKHRRNKTPQHEMSKANAGLRTKYNDDMFALGVVALKMYFSLEQWVDFTELICYKDTTIQGVVNMLLLIFTPERVLEMLSMFHTKERPDLERMHGNGASYVQYVGHQGSFHVYRGAWKKYEMSVYLTTLGDVSYIRVIQCMMGFDALRESPLNILKKVYFQELGHNHVRNYFPQYPIIKFAILVQRAQLHHLGTMCYIVKFSGTNCLDMHYILKVYTKDEVQDVVVILQLVKRKMHSAHCSALSPATHIPSWHVVEQPELYVQTSTEILTTWTHLYGALTRRIGRLEALYLIWYYSRSSQFNTKIHCDQRHTAFE